MKPHSLKCGNGKSTIVLLEVFHILKLLGPLSHTKHYQGTSCLFHGR